MNLNVGSTMANYAIAPDHNRNGNLKSKLNRTLEIDLKLSKWNRRCLGSTKRGKLGMPKKGNSSKRDAGARTEKLFMRANDHWEKGNLRAAFRIFLAAAKAGNAGSQLNVGHFYDEGIGIRANRSAALYWYKRLYRRKNAAAAANIGTIWRDEGDSKRALGWFEKAIGLGDDDANLDIAKIYLSQQDIGKAIPYLEKTFKSNNVTEASAEEARSLFDAVTRTLRADHLPRDLRSRIE